jgi:P pilus assembly chaperone PapD
MSFLLGVIFSATTNAGGILVTPARIEKIITENNHSFSIKVKNEGKEPLFIHTHVVGLAADLKGTPIFIEENQKGAPLPSIIGIELLKIKPHEFELAPSELKEVLVDVSIPENYTGGAYSVIFFEALPKAKEFNNITTVSRIGVLSLLTFPSDNLIKDGKIKHIEVEQEESLIKILLDFYNSGNIHFLVGGYAIIQNEKKEEIAKVSFKPGIVLPKYTRQIEAIWKPKEEELKIGKNYNVLCNISFKEDRTYIGSSTTFSIDKNSKIKE